MTELLAIVGVAVLFAVFGLLRGQVEEETHGCGSCSGNDSPGQCHACDHEKDGMAVGP